MFFLQNFLQPKNIGAMRSVFCSRIRHVNFIACICGVTQTALTVLSVIQSSSCSYDDVTIAHLSNIMHVFHIPSRYDALLLKLTVKDHDTSATTATPELLVDDTQTAKPSW